VKYHCRSTRPPSEASGQLGEPSARSARWGSAPTAVTWLPSAEKTSLPTPVACARAAGSPLSRSTTTNSSPSSAAAKRLLPEISTAVRPGRVCSCRTLRPLRISQ